MVTFKRHVVPHWGCADTWVKYRAQDLNGDWYFFSSKPTINNEMCSWDCEKEKFIIFRTLDIYPDNENWKTTLEKKPNKTDIPFNNIKKGNFVILSNNQIGCISEIHGGPSNQSSFRIKLFDIKTFKANGKYFNNNCFDINNRHPETAGNHSAVTGCYIGSEVDKYVSRYEGIIIIDVFTKKEISII